MKIRMLTKIGLFAFGAAVLPMLTAGCDNKKHESARKPAPRKMEPARAVDSVLEIQAINGAHNDPSLSYAHFDGAELNSLGRSKMQLILRGTSPGKPVVVYLDLGRSDMTQARRETIERYWKDSMMTQAHLELRDGAPEVAGSARDGLTRLPMTHSNPKGTGMSSGSAAPGAGSQTGSSNNSSGSGPQDTLFK